MGIDEARSRVWLARRALVAAIVALTGGNAAALAVHERERPRPTETVNSAGAVAAPSAEAGPAPAGDLRPEVSTTAPAPPVKQPDTATVAEAASPVDFPLVSEGYQYDVQLSPACARPGEVLTAVARVKPGVQSTATFMPFYSDGTNEPGGGSLAEPDGTVRYSWVARPIPGEGRLVTQAMDGDTGKFGTKIVAFRVAAGGKSC